MKMPLKPQLSARRQLVEVDWRSIGPIFCLLGNPSWIFQLWLPWAATSENSPGLPDPQCGRSCWPSPASGSWSGWCSISRKAIPTQLQRCCLCQHHYQGPSWAHGSGSGPSASREIWKACLRCWCRRRWSLWTSTSTISPGEMSTSGPRFQRWIIFQHVWVHPWFLSLQKCYHCDPLSVQSKETWSLAKYGYCELVS